MQDRVIVKVPASTANLGPGFDTLGMALSLYSWVSIAPSTATRITLLGPNMDGLPTDKSNLIYKVAQLVFERLNVQYPELDIVLCSDIPLTRGLGSSASAIIGALVAANKLCGDALSDEELFRIATDLEKHPDNVGASLFGGIIVAAWDGAEVKHVRLEPPAGLGVIAVIPQFELETHMARSVLPQQYSRADAVFNVGHSSLLTAALASGRLELLSHAMRDRLHQPYRASLIPGMESILRDAADRGALGAALSGAGPTLLLLVDRAVGAVAAGKTVSSGAGSKSLGGGLETFVRETMAAHQVGIEMMHLDICMQGPQVKLLSPDHPLYAAAPNEVIQANEAEVIL